MPREFAKTFGLTFPMLLDRAGAHYPASAAWRVTNVPSLFRITADRPMEWTLKGLLRKGLEAFGFRTSGQVPESKFG